MLVADAATTFTAGFAAVAALAAWATVATDWWRQRKARQPNVSAGLLDYGDGRGAIEFVHAGPGLAIQLAYLLSLGSPSGKRHGEIVGTGHLQAGERARVELGYSVPRGETADFVWVCRDIDQRLHIWSNDGRHEHLQKGEYPKLGESFKRMYPNAFLAPPNVGATEDSTQPGETRR
jgi:hypothetical protein